MRENENENFIEPRKEFLVIEFSKIQLHFSLVGIFFYFSIVFIFLYYLDNSSFIKDEIFSFIFIKSLSSLILLFITDEKYKAIFSYISQVISFGLILSHINKCITQKRIVYNIKGLRINDKIYIVLIFMLSFFPFESFIKLELYEILFINATKVLLTIFLYYHINKKIKLLLERLKQQEIKSKQDNDKLNGKKDIYYSKMIISINSMYFKGFTSFILYILINTYLIYNFNEYIDYIAKFFYFISFIFMSLAGLLFFFCSNRIELDKLFRNEKFKNNSKKFEMINQEDSDEEENKILNK